MAKGYPNPLIVYGEKKIFSRRSKVGFSGGYEYFYPTQRYVGNILKAFLYLNG